MQTQETPSVLAVIVTRNGASWLRRVLSSVARQTHRRLGVLAVDNASTDGSGELLDRVVGHRRVLRLDEDRGLAGAVRRALEVPAAKEADFILLLHDDVTLAPDAVERLVEAAGRVPGVGVVGPKVLDWERDRMLREVGFSADRFGYPQSPLEEGELDQGQYDAPREVLFVSSTAMLVARAAWTRAGLPDDRLTPADGDLDYCWRLRLAGFRVMVTPSAIVHHLQAGGAGQRPGGPRPRDRYRVERAALAALLTNYRLVTLLWVLPLYVVQGLGWIVLFLLARRFDRAGEVMAAWGWNVAHLPGTFRRRVRAQALRRVPDREIGRFMSPATARLTRWGQQASSLVVGRRTAWVEEGEELEAPPLPRRVASVVAAHPVAVASIAAAVFTLVAFRGVLFVPRIEGGALPVFPDSPADFFGALAAPWRGTGFGGPEMPSPALVPLGVGSFVSLGDPHLLARLLVALTPLMAGVSCHVALRRLGATSGSSVLGAISYAMSAVVLWSASEGRVSVAILLWFLPWLSARLAGAFAPGGPRRPLRWTVGTGMVLALALSFFPAVRLALAIVVAPLLLLPERGGNPVRGALLSLGAAAAAAALAFPLVAHLAEAGGGAAVEANAPANFGALLRLSPGDAPGAGPTALFLPVAGLVGFVLARGPSRRATWRALIAAAVAIPLAWLAAAGRLPAPISNPVAFLAAAAVSLAFLVGLGTGGLGWAVRRAAFGAPQALGALLVGVLVLGIAAQSIQGLLGNWAVGGDRLPPAWPVVAAADRDLPFRVLWLGPDDGRPFPPPGGDPDGAVAGQTSVAYGVSGPAGRSVLATALPAAGPPYERLERILSAVLSGRIRHGGALLAPMGIRFVVAGEGRLPAAAAEALAGQLDLDLVQRAGGLAIYRNARVLPEAAALPGQAPVDAARAASLLATLSFDPASAAPLSVTDGGWRGQVSESPFLVFVGDRFDPRWRAGEEAPFPAFGWALGFEGTPGRIEVTFSGRTRRTVELGALAILWLLALWFVRRTGREEPRTEARARAGVGEETAGEPAGSRA
jgi:GT2 family glycosyltransferase